MDTCVNTVERRALRVRDLNLMQIRYSATGFVVLVAVGAVGLKVGVGVVVVLFREGGAPTAAVGKRQPVWGRTGVVMVIDECRGASEECLREDPAGAGRVPN